MVSRLSCCERNAKEGWLDGLIGGGRGIDSYASRLSGLLQVILSAGAIKSHFARKRGLQVRMRCTSRCNLVPSLCTETAANVKRRCKVMKTESLNTQAHNGIQRLKCFLGMFGRWSYRFMTRWVSQQSSACKGGAPSGGLRLVVDRLSAQSINRPYRI